MNPRGLYSPWNKIVYGKMKNPPSRSCSRMRCPYCGRCYYPDEDVGGFCSADCRDNVQKYWTWYTFNDRMNLTISPKDFVPECKVRVGPLSLRSPLEVPHLASPFFSLIAKISYPIFWTGASVCDHVMNFWKEEIRIKWEAPNRNEVVIRIIMPSRSLESERALWCRNESFR